MGNLTLDLAYSLADAGFGDASGNDITIFRDMQPDVPDSIVTLFEHSGGAVGENVQADNRAVQVRVRDVNYTAAREKAWGIFRHLDRPLDRIWRFDGGRWAIIKSRQTPFKLKTDRRDRVEFAFNLSVITNRDH